MDLKDEGKDSEMKTAEFGTLSDLYPSACSAWVNLPEARSVALREIHSHKPSYHSSHLKFQRTSFDQFSEVAMSDGSSVRELDLSGQELERPSWFQRVKTLLGFRTAKATKPNVKVDILNTEVRDELLDELGLTQNELLVSDMYKVLEDRSKEQGELVVPLEMPDRSIPPELMYDFTYCIKDGDTWTKDEAKYKEGGYVNGRLVKMDVFCVIAALKPEHTTVQPEGTTFVSSKDERMSLKFPEKAVNTETEFIVTTDAVDRQRFEEYQKNIKDFQKVIGVSNILSVSPSTRLSKSADLTLPLDINGDFNGDTEEYKIVCLHWTNDGEEDDVEILDTVPSSAESGLYNVPVESFSGHSFLAVNYGTTYDEQLRLARHVHGLLNMCVILTFVDYEPGRRVNYLLVNCVEFNKAEIVAQQHCAEGFKEVKHSRSRDVEVKNKAKIKLSVTGSIKQISNINSFNFHQTARTNHVVIHFVHTAGLDCNIRFFWGREDHKVYFSLDQYGTEGTLARPRTSRRPHTRAQRKRSEGKGQASPRNRPTSPQRNRPMSPQRSMATRHDRQNSTDLIPVLSDKSLSALADNLSTITVRRIGIELGIQDDLIDNIFEKAERTHSSPNFALLKDWRTKNFNNPYIAINQLIAACKELGRNDIAQVIENARDTDTVMRRRGFDPDGGQAASSQVSEFMSSGISSCSGRSPDEMSDRSESVLSGSTYPESTEVKAVDAGSCLSGTVSPSQINIDEKTDVLY